MEISPYNSMARSSSATRSLAFAAVQMICRVPDGVQRRYVGIHEGRARDWVMMLIADRHEIVAVMIGGMPHSTEE